MTPRGAQETRGQEHPRRAQKDTRRVTWALCNQRGAFQSRFGTPGDALEAPKPRKIHGFYRVLRIAAGAVQRVPRGLQEPPK